MPAGNQETRVISPLDPHTNKTVVMTLVDNKPTNIRKTVNGISYDRPIVWVGDPTTQFTIGPTVQV